jgi:hypothetical protein
MADRREMNALRRFAGGAEGLNTIYAAAWEAHTTGATTVTILASQFEGGQASGQMLGVPLELCDSCEMLLAEIEATELGEEIASGPVHSDFSRQPSRT